MAFDAAMERSLVAALSTEEVSNDLLNTISTTSAALTRFRTIRMSRAQVRMPVVDTLPMAYFVNGDTGLKSTTDMSWKNKYLNVEEIATIIPIPEAVLDDSEYDIWGTVRPLAIGAAARVLDSAVFLGVNKPSSWPLSIVDGATAVGNVVTRGTSAASVGSIAGDISNAYETIEAEGYNATGAIASMVYKGLLRNVRNVQGDRLPEVSPNEAYGVPITYPLEGLWPSGHSEPEFIAGDFSQGIVGIRQDFTWKVLDQAVIQDNTGATIFNLAQQDSIALRMVFRVAFQVANTKNYQQEDEAERYPFAVIESPAS